LKLAKKVVLVAVTCKQSTHSNDPCQGHHQAKPSKARILIIGELLTNLTPMKGRLGSCSQLLVGHTA